MVTSLCDLSCRLMHKFEFEFILSLNSVCGSVYIVYGSIKCDLINFDVAVTMAISGRPVSFIFFLFFCHAGMLNPIQFITFSLPIDQFSSSTLSNKIKNQKTPIFPFFPFVETNSIPRVATLIQCQRANQWIKVDKSMIKRFNCQTAAGSSWHQDGTSLQFEPEWIELVLM